jgi:hypothetical protein
MADPNILMQFKTAQMPDLMGSLQNAAETKNKMMQSQAMQRDMDTQTNLDKAYQMAGGDINKMAGDPSLGFRTGVEISNLQAQNAKAKADAKKAEVDNQFQMYSRGAQILGAAKNQNEWDQQLQIFGQLFGGEALSHIPKQYSPEAQKQQVDMGLSAAERISQQRADQQTNYQNAQLGLMGERIAASERNAAARGDGGDKTKYTIIYDAQGNAYTKDVNRPDEPPIPMKMPSGSAPQVPAQGAPDGSVSPPPASFRKAVAAPSTPKSSEDERKAAGWVNQARLASQQMNDAILKDPTASDQGIIETVLPSGLSRPILSEQRQRFNDAASSFAEAALRAATGAGINESEAKQKIYELTPRYGDKPSAIQDKVTRQEMYLKSLESRAGSALQPADASTPTTGRPPLSSFGGR